jgi:hypothetical protein
MHRPISFAQVTASLQVQRDVGPQCTGGPRMCYPQVIGGDFPLTEFVYRDTKAAEYRQ